MVSALFIVMVVIVATAAVGREISDEFDRIGRGERPPDDEVRREWDTLIKEVSSRTEMWRVRVDGWRKSRAIGIRRAPRSRDRSAESQPERRTPPE
jgi:membrane protein